MTNYGSRNKSYSITRSLNADTITYDFGFLNKSFILQSEKRVLSSALKNVWASGHCLRNGCSITICKKRIPYFYTFLECVEGISPG